MTETFIDPLPEAFSAQIDASGDCWLWTGSTDSYGYGIYHVDGARPKAHRFIWETLVALIPPGMYIDHMCRVKNCVNPDHLRVLTPSESSKDSAKRAAMQWKRAQTACIHGHPFTEENTYINPTNGTRRCRACARVRDRARWPRKPKH